VRRPWTGAVGKSAPMDGGYLPHETNTPAVGSRIQVKDFYNGTGVRVTGVNAVANEHDDGLCLSSFKLFGDKLHRIGKRGLAFGRQGVDQLKTLARSSLPGGIRISISLQSPLVLCP